MAKATWGAVVVGLGLAAGCGPREPPLVPVEGTVTVNGEPLAEGNVMFAPADGRVPQVLEVARGAYAGRTRAVRCRVEVHAYKEVPNPDPHAPAYEKTILKSLIPQRYNLRTELTADVTEAGPNRFDFRLTGP